jgi:hypothetical protein
MDSITKTISLLEYLSLGGKLENIDLSKMYTTRSSEFAYQPLVSLTYREEDDTFWVSFKDTIKFPYKAWELSIKAELTLYKQL